jgi:uncharacterized iron-regulated membrane protein
MKRFRRIIFWCHLSAGVIGGIIILIMSVTGAMLAFQPQIERFADREARVVSPPSQDGVRLGPQELFAKALEARPDIKPSALTMQADPTAAASYSLGRDGSLYLNPYTGEALGESAKGVRSFFQTLNEWHRWLGSSGERRAAGRAVTGACNAAFLALAMSGLYLWWPKNWTRKNLSSVTVFKRGLKGRPRDFNWHNVTGFWCSIALILLTSTGLVMSYQWANNLLYTLTGSLPPPQAPQAAVGQSEPSRMEISGNLNQLWTRAEQQTAGWESISLRLPQRPDMPVSFTIREGRMWNPMASSQLTLDPATAEVVRWESYTSLSPGRRLRSWARFTHTGETGRLPGQIIACLASLGGALLVWTGLSLALRRLRAWQAHLRISEPIAKEYAAQRGE